jgi:hypothetical protein
MQRQPESSMFDDTTNRASITIESLSVDAAAIDVYKNMMQMSLSASDSFDMMVLDKSTPSFRVRRKSSALLSSVTPASMESFNCSLSSLKDDVDVDINVDVFPDCSSSSKTTKLTTTAIVADDEGSATEADDEENEIQGEGIVPVTVNNHDNVQSSPRSADIPFSMILPSTLFNLDDMDKQEQQQQQQQQPGVPEPHPVSLCSSTTSESSTTSRKSTCSSSTSKSVTTPSIVTSLHGPTTAIMNVPGPYDVVCGRNSSGYNCIGNRRFRVSITMNVDRYMNAPTREEKTHVVQQLATTLIDDVGCRFLKKTGKNQFVVMDRKQIREKVGHSLRDLVNLKKKGGYKGRFLDY